MIYLDNAATTKPFPEVVATVNNTLTRVWGNANSPYLLGREANQVVCDCRKRLAETIGADTEEIYFTSGGSEANSWAIKGFDGYKIITTPIEHHSILNAVKDKDVYYLSVNNIGLIDLRELRRVLEVEKKPCLVSIQYVNNETGVCQDIYNIGKICKEYGAIFHTDAVQAYSHFCYYIDVDQLKIDMMSVSGHKFGAPTGIGFLYIRKGIDIKPLINGGEQNFGLRGGTDNVAYIKGMCLAAEIIYENHSRDYHHIHTLQCHLIDKLYDSIKLFKTSPINLTHGIVSITISGMDAAGLIEYLSLKEIYISSGSACSSNSGEPSHVLKAIGYSDEDAASTIRVSFSADNTHEETDTFIDAVVEYLKLTCPEQVIDKTELT